jgi:surface antigen
MLKRTMMSTVLMGSLALFPLTGCEDLPGDEGTQGAVIGGVGGAVAGAALGGEDNRLLGALIGGALGAGGGYLIGSQIDKADDEDDAREANTRARENPVTVEQARKADTADVNKDGYVTLDEVVALEKAGLSDDQIIRKLERTDQFFELTDEQEDYLADRGVSREVIDRMEEINASVRDRAYDRYGDRVSRNDRVSSNPDRKLD